MSTAITLFSSHSWQTVALPLMIAALRDGAKLTAVAGNTAKSSKQAIKAIQALVTFLSNDIRLAVTDACLVMTDTGKGTIHMALTGTATFLSHCIPIVPISTLFTVKTCCVPHTFQALACDGITITIFLRVYVAIAFTGNTRLSRHQWISIVTICTPFTPRASIAWKTFITDNSFSFTQLAGRTEIVCSRAQRTGTGLAVLRSSLGWTSIKARQALITERSCRVVLTSKANTLSIAFSCMPIAFAGLTNTAKEYSIHPVVARETGLT